jgi:hypothetical protein
MTDSQIAREEIARLVAENELLRAALRRAEEFIRIGRDREGPVLRQIATALEGAAS